jgi:acetyl-CoA carboxylase carboxyltransferase component
MDDPRKPKPADPKDWGPEVRGIEERRRRALELGGAEAVERQHSLGRLTVRERIAGLLDPESFSEIGPISGYGEVDSEGRLEGFTPANYVLGIGHVDGRPCVVGGEDFTQRGGAPSSAGLRKSVYAEEVATQYRLPLVRLLEGGGGSVARPAGRQPPAGEPTYSRHRFVSIARCMGTAPVVSAALGPVAGFPAARLVASHFSIMVRETAQVLIGGPALVERALGERKTKEELGGFDVHMRSGVVDNLAQDERDAFEQIRRFLSYLPSNVWESPPVAEPDDDPQRTEPELLGIVPRDRRRPYDMRRLLRAVLDRDSLFEIAPLYGRSQITALARLNGHPVGVLGNDPKIYAGAMCAGGAQKVRRFVDLCDTFHLPIVSFVDEPGFMIGSAAERAATIRYGTAALCSVVQSTVPWASVLVRKAFGVAAAAHFGPEGLVVCWPSVETGALPLEGGVAVAYRREIESAPDPAARRRELESALAAQRSPFPRAEAFSVHDLLDPRQTRPVLCRWVEWMAPRVREQLGPRAYTYRP